MQGILSRVLSRPRVVRRDDDLCYLVRVLYKTFLTSRRTATRRPVKVATLEDVEASDLKPTGQPEHALEIREL